MSPYDRETFTTPGLIKSFKTPRDGLKSTQWSTLKQAPSQTASSSIRSSPEVHAVSTQPVNLTNVWQQLTISGQVFLPTLFPTDAPLFLRINMMPSEIQNGQLVSASRASLSFFFIRTEMKTGMNIDKIYNIKTV